MFLVFSITPLMVEIYCRPVHFMSARVLTLGRRCKRQTHLEVQSLTFANSTNFLSSICAGNEIEDRGVQLIAESLNSNYTLETLGLSNNNVTEMGAAQIQNTLDGNLSLRELNLAWNLLRCGGAMGIHSSLVALKLAILICSLLASIEKKFVT